MPKFSTRSKKSLKSCDPKLQEIFNEVIKHFDCVVLEGARSKEKQDDLFHQNLSKLKWPESMHNHMPSLACDVAPFPIDWEDSAAHYYFAGLVKGIALSKGIRIIWGGDWDGDNDLHDQSFFDLVHFELAEDPTPVEELSQEEVDLIHEFQHT